MRYTCRTLIDQIGETGRGGVSIIRIEHVVHALVTSIDRLLVLHNGVFVADGDPQNPAVVEIHLGIESDV